MRNTSAIVAFVFATAVIIPNVLVSTAYADQGQLTARSIQMSNSTVGSQAPGQNVTYKLTFTPAQAATVRAIAIDFCAESPIIGYATCTKPTGLTIGTSVTGTPTMGTWSGAILANGHTLVLTASADQSFTVTPFIIEVTGFTNPSVLTAFYGRVLTYATSAGANGYTSANPNAVASYIDAGGVALRATDDINITAAVMESLTFCISAAAPGVGCTGTSSPTLTLGSGTPPALSITAVDTADAYFQLSTNAAGTTYVNLKTSAASGGLNSGSTNNIAPVDHATAPQPIVAGTPRFGMQVGTAAGIGPNTFGTVTGDAAYASTTNYNMRSTEARSTYGDTIATASGAVGDVNVPLKFAATAGNTTPAGLYSTNISLIASSSY